jgi:hypothetical protein
MDEARRHEPLRVLDTGLAARGIDAREGDRDVGIVGRELCDLIVGRVRPPGQRLVDGEDDTANLPGAVILGLRRPVARRGAGPADLEVLRGGLLGLGERFLVLEMHVDVERAQLADVDPWSGHATAPLSRTCAPGASA